MTKAIEELNATIEVLHGDVQCCAAALAEQGSQFWRRTLVRAIFAQIEGVMFCMKAIAFACRHQPGVKFSVGELIVLIEKSYRPNDRGEAEEQRMQLSFSNNIKFTFKAFGRANLIDYALKVGDNRWNDLKNSLRVRDRLMHPKRSSDLYVSDDEMNELQRALIGLRKTLLR